MNVDRRLPDGSKHREEVINKSQIYVTTAGWKNSFAYEKLMQILIQSIIYPEEAIVLGGTWRVPVMAGLLNRTFIQELKLDGTYNDAQFGREYEQEWSGDIEKAFFSAEKFDSHRVLQQPEYEYSTRISKDSYYVIGVDVGRKGCTTEAIVIKVTPQPQGTAIKQVVNLYSYEDYHFEDQAKAIKELYYRYRAKKLVIDANGLGIGLIDYMVKPQYDHSSNTMLYPDFGVDNDEEGFYKQYKTSRTEQGAMFLIKAQAPLNTEAHSYLQQSIINGKIKFLIDENKAKSKLMATKGGQAMTPEKRAEYLRPFTCTTILRDQMMNLIEENEGVNIILKQDSRKIRKDKFSALEYGMYYIKKEEDNKKRKRFNVQSLIFMN